MKITPQDVKTFQKIYRIRTGSSLKKDAAYKKLQQLLLQVETVYKPITLADVERLSIEIDEHEKYVEPPEYV